MAARRDCPQPECPRNFRWLLDLFEHLVRDHGLDAQQLPAPAPIGEAVAL